MKKTETRSVEVNYCDGCKKEAQHLEKCAVCKKEFCMEEGGKKHFLFGIKIYNYTYSDRASTHICKSCAELKINLTLDDIFSCMPGPTPLLSARTT